ncbi:uncharacterized protein [Zea mays]|uniref:Uncharacterized protein n=1 Tax=Zea mays TaxID=4577 RepID=A0A804MQB1_MAIZE|nr:uncharacterized protein LOC103647624 [Zea mays]|eukprot:XP_008670358.1 uncharacterized protein LOC103647624 [Zea mays]
MTPIVASLSLAHLVVALLLMLLALLCVDASVHDYDGERFATDGNAFVLHGGTVVVRVSTAPLRVARSSALRRSRSKDARVGDRSRGGRQPHDHGHSGHLQGRRPRRRRGHRRLRRWRAGALLHMGHGEGGEARGLHRGGAVMYRARNDNTGWPRVLAASFLPGGLDAAFPVEGVVVARTGMYTLLFVHCDASLAGGQVATAGKTIWKNSRCYLPDRMASLVPFYGAKSLALAASWFAQCARF